MGRALSPELVSVYEVVVSPETREAAKTAATSMFLPPFPRISQATVDIVPKNNEQYPSQIYCSLVQAFDLAVIWLALWMLEVGTELIIGKNTPLSLAACKGTQNARRDC